MQVLVVGATGTLGRQIARRALDAGHQVRCMVRSPRKAAFLQEWGCELTRGDLLESESLDYALEGREAVIDAATARAGDAVSAYDVDWSGKQNLFAACGRAEVKRVVFTSLPVRLIWPEWQLQVISAILAGTISLLLGSLLVCGEFLLNPRNAKLQQRSDFLKRVSS
jgi:uncharacterized protein YbjT (DUF2867 family)